jgi:hypothetical protein
LLVSAVVLVWYACGWVTRMMVGGVQLAGTDSGASVDCLQSAT